VLLILVIEMDVLRRFFTTTNLTSGQWLACAAVGASIVVVAEVVKAVAPARQRRSRGATRALAADRHG
jgi:Ca2+-transporting ATPase